MPIDERTSIHLADLFSALSDPTRLAILSALMEREMSVGEIAGAINLSESAVSHQLRGLRQMRIVRPRKEGRQVFYCLDDEHVAQLFQMGLNHIIHN
jgi:ArsR family transcriptional regulator, lead/cadmium/zinc/bismuth-responsive transcriptional repressor